MPLYHTFEPTERTRILIWEITESFDDLFDQVRMTDKSLIRLNGMKSDMQQRAFLSVRMLLQDQGYTDFDLYYDENGKPHLKDGLHISITHSFEYAAVIISDTVTGIDIEKQ